jgi:hypothetical protein
MRWRAEYAAAFAVLAAGPVSAFAAPESPGAPMELRDIAPPVSEWPGGPGSLVIGALVLVVLAGAGIIWLRMRGRRRVPPLNSRETALRDLQVLESENLADADVFHTRLSRIVRDYLDGQFGISAPRRTTRAILAEVGADGCFAPTQRDQLREMLERCDAIKFARVEPPTGWRAIEAARAFVLATSTEPSAP